LIRILIYEDNQKLREGLAALLSVSGAFEICGTFANAAAIKEHIIEHRPHLVLMDIDMPVTNGIQGITLAKEMDDTVKILMYTVFEDEDKIFAALTAGADGYLLKNSSGDKLIEALHCLQQGESPMTPAIARKVLNYFSAKKIKQPTYELTEKEKEVLRCLTQGLSYKLIAAEMSISIETVRTHIKHIYGKLHVSSSTQAVSKALNEKLI
jgi:DNA-binding NarL/FixJ family response regulator